MVEKRSLKFTGLNTEKVKLLIAITILLSSFMAVASPGDTPPIANCGEPTIRPASERPSMEFEPLDLSY